MVLNAVQEAFLWVMLLNELLAGTLCVVQMHELMPNKLA